MSQTENIIAWLKPRGRTINPLQALKKFGCFRLGARAWDIHKLGHPIDSRMVYNKKNGKKWAEYFFR